MFDLTKNVKHFLSSQAFFVRFAFFEVKATTTGLHFLFQKSFFCQAFFEGRATTTTSLLHFCFTTTYPLKSVSFQKCKQ
jgi:hypothetical protein